MQVLCIETSPSVEPGIINTKVPTKGVIYDVTSTRKDQGVVRGIDFWYILRQPSGYILPYSVRVLNESGLQTG